MYFYQLFMFLSKHCQIGSDFGTKFIIPVFENLGSNSLPQNHKCVSNPGCALKFTHSFLLQFQSKVVSLCQSVPSKSRGGGGGGGCGEVMFCWSNHQGIPTTPAVGENIDRSVTQYFFAHIAVSIQ